MILKGDLLIRSKILRKTLYLIHHSLGFFLLGIYIKALSNSFSLSSVSQKSLISLVRKGKSLAFRMLERFIKDLPYDI